MWRDEPSPAREYLVGVDLAQGGADFTALCVVERAELIDGTPAEYGVIHLERWRDPRTARIPERVGAALGQLTLLHRQREFERTGYGVRSEPATRVVADQTGVGPFGLDPLRAAGLAPIGIVITGGDAVSHPDPFTYRVPKRDLAGIVNVLLQSGRLRIEATLPDAAVLRTELENFHVRISVTGHDSYAAGAGEEWRLGSHDDLILSLAVALWVGEVQRPVRLDPVIAAAFVGLPN